MRRRTALVLTAILGTATSWTAAQAPTFDPHGDANSGVERVVTEPSTRGQCTQCHPFHGDPTAPDPNVLFTANDNGLCYTCHDGNPAAKNLVANFAKTYRHPVTLSSRHTTTEDGQPVRYGTANRHSECGDCHNVHQLTPDPVPPVPPIPMAAYRATERGYHYHYSDDDSENGFAYVLVQGDGESMNGSGNSADWKRTSPTSRAGCTARSRVKA